MLIYNANLTRIFYFLVKLIEYIFSAVKVCCNPCVVPLPKIKISFFLLSILVDELIPTQNFIIFWPNPHLEMKNLIFYQIQFQINPKPECLYLLMSPFLVKVTAPIFLVLNHYLLCCQIYLFDKQCKYLLVFHDYMQLHFVLNSFH